MAGRLSQIQNFSTCEFHQERIPKFILSTSRRTGTSRWCGAIVQRPTEHCKSHKELRKSDQTQLGQMCVDHKNVIKSAITQSELYKLSDSNLKPHIAGIETLLSKLGHTILADMPHKYDNIPQVPSKSTKPASAVQASPDSSPYTHSSSDHGVMLVSAGLFTLNPQLKSSTILNHPHLLPPLPLLQALMFFLHYMKHSAHYLIHMSSSMDLYL